MRARPEAQIKNTQTAAPGVRCVATPSPHAGKSQLHCARRCFPCARKQPTLLNTRPKSAHLKRNVSTHLRPIGSNTLKNRRFFTHSSVILDRRSHIQRAALTHLRPIGSNTLKNRRIFLSTFFLFTIIASNTFEQSETHAIK